MRSLAKWLQMILNIASPAMPRMKTTIKCLGIATAIACCLSISMAGAAETKRPDTVQRKIDDALNRQEQMVAEAVGKLAPQRPGVRDVYFIGVAGWGDQDVFRKEVRAVRKLFERSFQAEGHAVSLVNNLETLDTAPLATGTSIEAAIMATASVMDPDEDLLVLFMTSHGREWEGFALELNETDLGRMMPAQLARMLGASRIRNRVVIVSGCFSGQFVPALAEERTLLMTAAASDRTSFGCSNDAEWTWFGRAFFAEALPKLKKFEPAFAEAAKRIARWEKEKDYTPSEPQIRVGSDIRKVLDELGY